MADATGALSADTVLGRADNLTVRLRTNGDTVVGIGDTSFQGGAHTLAVLDVFARPMPFGSAVAILQSRTAGAQDWVDLTETIVNLCKAGLLVRPGDDGRPAVRDPYLYENPLIHIKMLDDRARTASFIDGIREVVRPGDVVVDLGTGTGVLAVAAVQAGARRVYAMEAGGASRFARAMFEANGCTDRVELLEGWSTQLELPEKADVLVSEMIGNEPLGERVLEATLDARKRFLTPGARLVPNRVRVLCTPMSLSAETRNRWRFTATTTEKWSGWYGMDFTPLVGAVRDWSYFAYADVETVQSWASLGPPAVLADIDLTEFDDVRVEQRGTIELASAGTMDGLVVHFDLHLGTTAVLGVDPTAVDSNSHWKYPVWLSSPAPEVHRGDRFHVSYRYRTGSEGRTLELTPA